MLIEIPSDNQPACLTRAVVGHLNQQSAIDNQQSVYSLYFLNSSDAFVPPKPKEFERA